MNMGVNLRGNLGVGFWKIFPDFQSNIGGYQNRSLEILGMPIKEKCTKRKMLTPTCRCAILLISTVFTFFSGYCWCGCLGQAVMGLLFFCLFWQHLTKKIRPHFCSLTTVFQEKFLHTASDLPTSLSIWLHFGYTLNLRVCKRPIYRHLGNDE